MKQTYDVVVIGAGSGGLTAAVGLQAAGKKVLLIEKDKIGGECTHAGCIPSKALLHHAKSYHEAHTIAGTTQATETYRKNALAYVQSVIAAVYADETEEHFTARGIEVVTGEAVFTGSHSLSVGDQQYSFKKAIIATGSAPRPLTIAGLAAELTVTNQNIFELTEVPEQLLIIGAGPIGLELGQAFAMLGSTVTLIDNGPRLARLEDEAISPIISKIFQDLGITVLHNAEVAYVEGTTAFATIKDNAGEVVETKSVPFTKTLIAIGRVPNFPEGLSTAQVSSSVYGITVNRNWQTTNKHIYALGDVAAQLKFTHVADDTARQVVAHLVSKGLIRVKTKHVPKVTYTEPEMAQVGLSWTDAKSIYSEDSILRIEVPFSANDRARTDDATDGLCIFIAKRISGKILGCHIIAPRAGELIGTVTLAMENNISLYRLRSTIFAYPTYSLILKKAGDYFLAQHILHDLATVGKKIAPKLLVLFVWLAGLFLLYSYKQSFGLTTGELSLKLFEAITSYTWAPILYIVAYAIRPLTFFPGTALTILSGVFFGVWGILYTIIGANLSATVAYGVGRFFSKKTPDATSLLAAWTAPLHSHPFLTILTMRLTFFPFDAVNYGAGLFRTPFAPYISATILGTLLGIVTFVSIGASLSVEEFSKNGISTEAIDSKFIILSVVIFIASLVVAKFMKRN